MRLRLALTAFGSLIAAVGIALVFLPAALIVFGCAVACGALLWDDGKP